MASRGVRLPLAHQSSRPAANHLAADGGRQSAQLTATLPHHAQPNPTTLPQNAQRNPTLLPQSAHQNPTTLPRLARQHIRLIARPTQTLRHATKKGPSTALTPIQ